MRIRRSSPRRRLGFSVWTACRERSGRARVFVSFAGRTRARIPCQGHLFVGIVQDCSSWRAEAEGREASMTEAEWLACTDLPQMPEFLGGRVSERKGRLLACACPRRAWTRTDSLRGGV